MTGPQPIIIQNKGFGAELRAAANPLIQALMFKRQQDSRQQALQIQKQQVELQGISQRNLEKQRASQQFFQLMDQFGPDILEDPVVAQRAGEAGLDPKSLLKTHKANVKKKQDALDQANIAFLNSVPPEVRVGAKVFVDSLQQFGREGATALMKQTFELTATQLSEEQKTKLAGQFPALFGPNAGITTEQGMEILAEVKGYETQLAMQVGPEWKRQRDAQIAQSRLNLDIAKATKDLLTGGLDLGDKFRAASLLNSMIEDELATNATAHMSKFGFEFRELPKREKIARVFGLGVAKAWINSLAILEEVLGPEQTPADTTVPLDTSSVPSGVPPGLNIVPGQTTSGR